MTLNDSEKKNVLALTVTVFMSVMYVTLVSIYIIHANSIVGDTIPISGMTLLILVPILNYIVFEYITKTTVKLIFAPTRKNESDQAESDPFLSWMKIIFSKED